MASYNVLIKRSAAKEIEALPKKDRLRVIDKIQRLATNPRPPGCEKLSGSEKYRLRQGDYRIVYEIVDLDQIVTVVKIGNRRDVRPLIVEQLKRFEGRGEMENNLAAKPRRRGESV